MKIAYSYGRFSTPEQAKGDSFRRQADSAKHWCKENGYTLSGRQFFDKGKSGFYGENFKEDGALKQFIQLHADGKIENDAVLIIDSVDRFSRLPVSKSAKYFLDVVYAGIGLAFSGSFDRRIITSDLIDKEPYVLQGIVGELNRAYRESEERSRKIKSAKAAKRNEIKNGLIVAHNNAPKYFTFVPEDGVMKRGAKGTYIPNDFTPYIRELIDGILAGKSLYGMAKDFNERNVPTAKCNLEWHRNTVRQILRSRSLVGEFMGNKKFFPPIIDETTFLKVQNILNQNIRNRGKRAHRVNFLRGLTYCAECGHAVVAGSRTYKGEEYRYFRCSNYGTRTACKKTYMRADLIERDFLFSFLAKDPYKLANNDDIAELKAINKEIAEKIDRLNKLTTKINGLLDLLSDDSLPVEQVKTKLRDAESERGKLKRRVDALNAKAATIQDIPTQPNQWVVRTTRFGEGENGEDLIHEFTEGKIANIQAALTDNAAREQLRVFLPSLVSKIVVDARKRDFAVFNRGGRKVYESPQFLSLNNNTPRWRESLTKWTTRKTAGGRVVEVKRYQNKYYEYKHGIPAAFKSAGKKSKVKSVAAK